MGRLGLNRVLECFSVSVPSTTCLCMNWSQVENGAEEQSLIESHLDQMVRPREILERSMTLAHLLEPKIVILKVSMHCNGCARKVQKHISKMEGVTSFKVDLESKKVVVMGDISPFEVLESVSKVKFAEMWVGPLDSIGT